MTRIQTEKRTLPTELSPEDLAKESQALAAAVETVAKQEEHIAEQKGLWTEKKKAMDGYLSHLKDEMNALATVVDTGVADREVDCSWLYALKQGYAFLVRDDNGELVHHRHLGDQERQESMLEVLREPTAEQLATWTESLGLVIDPQGDLPLEHPGDQENVRVNVTYYRVFVLNGKHGQERIIARFSEADHRPSSLTGVHISEQLEGPGLPEQVDRAFLEYEEDPDTLRTYRQALEDLLEAKQAESVRQERGEQPASEEDERPAPTPIGRGRKGSRE